MRVTLSQIQTLALAGIYTVAGINTMAGINAIADTNTSSCTYIHCIRCKHDSLLGSRLSPLSLSLARALSLPLSLTPSRCLSHEHACTFILYLSDPFSLALSRSRSLSSLVSTHPANALHTQNKNQIKPDATRTSGRAL